MTPHGAPAELSAKTPTLDSRGPIPLTWRDHAACLEEDPELFFPTGNADPAFIQIEVARLVCGRCQVAESCLTWAVDTSQDAGVWGGLSSQERRALDPRNVQAQGGR